MLIAVRIKDHGPLAGHLFQTVGVQLCLLLADLRRRHCFLRLNDSKREAVVAPQHVVNKALAGLCGHPVHLELTVPIVGEKPSRLSEVPVDKNLAGLRFREVQICAWCCLCSFFCCRDSCDQLGSLSFQLSDRLRQFRCTCLSLFGLCGLLVELLLKLLSISQRCLGCLAEIHQHCRIERSLRVRLTVTAVRPSQPLTKHKQRRHNLNCLQTRRRFRIMHGTVPGQLNLLRNTEQLAVRDCFERRLIQIGVQFVLIRQRQFTVVRERPLHTRLQTLPGVNHRRAGIRQRVAFRPLRHHKLVSKLRFQERELRTAHNSPRNARCCNDANRVSRASMCSWRTVACWRAKSMIPEKRS